MQLSRQDIRRSFSHNAFRPALDYAREGNVLDIVPSRDGLTLKSEVFGSGYKACKQTIRLSRTSSAIDGRCTCPVGGNCKHVAAALLEYFDLAESEEEIEAKVDELTSRKQALVSGILDGAEGGALGMTEADLDLLFGKAA